jgi:D-glycero-D-manno-heptose 1,7-bisphosphate phosphatase
MRMFPAIFLDRDGVLIQNVDTYVRSWADVVVFPWTLPAMVRLKNRSYKIVIVTNQSLVGRGIITAEEAERINERLVTTVQRVGGQIDGVFMCTHAPSANCDCRKPQPGLILQACAQLSLDLSRSVMIGDALSDILAGQNAGIPLNILVRTGRGDAQINLPEAKSMKPFLTCGSLEDAVDQLLSGSLLSHKIK